MTKGNKRISKGLNISRHTCGMCDFVVISSDIKNCEYKLKLHYKVSHKITAVFDNNEYVNKVKLDISKNKDYLLNTNY